MKQNLRETYVSGQVKTAFPAMFAEDCSGHIGKYATTGTGADYSVTYTSSLSHINTYALDMKTRATTPADGDVVTALKYLWIPPTKLIRAQCIYSPYVTTTNWLFDLLCTWYDGANYYSAGLRLQSSDNTVLYYNSAGVWTAINTWVTPNIARYWQHMDMSLDLANHTYRRVAVSHQVTDLSAQTIKATASALMPILVLAFNLTTKGAVQGRGFVAEALVTPEAL